MSLFNRKEALQSEIAALAEQVGQLKGEIRTLIAEKRATGEVMSLTQKITALKIEVSNLEIERAQKTEDFDRRERELTHKVGLEKTRQEQELVLAKREAKLEAGEANLTLERKDFTDRMKFREEQFDAQTKRFDTFLSQIVERLPTVTVGQTHNIEETVSAKRR